MVFGNGVKNIQATAYNGALRVFKMGIGYGSGHYNSLIYHTLTELSLGF